MAEFVPIQKYYCLHYERLITNDECLAKKYTDRADKDLRNCMISNELLPLYNPFHLCCPKLKECLDNYNEENGTDYYIAKD